VKEKKETQKMGGKKKIITVRSLRSFLDICPELLVAATGTFFSGSLSFFIYIDKIGLFFVLRLGGIIVLRNNFVNILDLRKKQIENSLINLKIKLILKKYINIFKYIEIRLIMMLLLFLAFYNI
jgi:hypothetical protein